MVSEFDNYKLYEIIDVVCDTLGVTKDQFLGTKRDRLFVDARRIVINIMLREESASVSNTARSINKDHATAVHYRKTHSVLYSSNNRYRNIYDVCVKKYKGESYKTLEDFLKVGDKYKEAKEKLKLLNSENAELRYTILKLENKIRQQHYAIV